VYGFPRPRRACVPLANARHTMWPSPVVDEPQPKRLLRAVEGVLARQRRSAPFRARLRFTSGKFRQKRAGFKNVGSSVRGADARKSGSCGSIGGSPAPPSTLRSRCRHRRRRTEAGVVRYSFIRYSFTGGLSHPRLPGGLSRRFRSIPFRHNMERCLQGISDTVGRPPLCRGALRRRWRADEQWTRDSLL
jgi:hypothetical protein